MPQETNAKNSKSVVSSESTSLAGSTGSEENKLAQSHRGTTRLLKERREFYKYNYEKGRIFEHSTVLTPNFSGVIHGDVRIYVYNTSTVNLS